MNDSFEVILNHDEFMKYKSIQKEYEKNCQVVLNLRHENENARLKCEQLEVTIRGHEFKIKELSKNSLRLSRRLLIQQQDHQKTQENLLNREKQWIQKILILTNQHQGATTSVQQLKEAKEKLGNENGSLKNQLSAQEQNMQAIQNFLSESQKMIKDWENRYNLVRKQFYQTTEENNQLKGKLQQFYSQKQKLIEQGLRNEEEARETNLKLKKQSVLLELLQRAEKKAMSAQYNAKLEEVNQICEELRATHDADVAKLEKQIHQQSQQNEQFRLQNDVLLTKCEIQADHNQKLKKELTSLLERLASMKTSLSNSKTYIKSEFQKYSSTFKQFSAKYQAVLRAHLEEEQTKKLKPSNKEQICEYLWQQYSQKLGIIRNQLKKDGIKEENTIIKLQFQQINSQFKKQLQGYIEQQFSKWLIL